jgi:uncharacterized RDD family membrane protein YckC
MSEDEKDGKQKKPFFVLRCLAYIIDGFLVLFLSALLSAPFVNSEQMLELAEESRSIVQKYSQNEMTEQEYLVEASNLEYKMSRSMELISIFIILVSVVYYVVLPIFLNGQTLGKKIFGMKIISTYGDLNANQLIFRTFLADFLLLNIISVLFLMFASRNIYLNCIELFTLAQYTITFASIIMVIVNKEGLAIHDGLVHTKVVKVK